ncbi:MAG: zinc ribbon domain-containing protein [Gammaproteobacteria bacterium]|nr:zinc ribbon domain-containing protein [Gammaproteobacteria bacterium]MDH5650430.1 zinc ribbon domain-containing protein [Gammaproteobacteria bacterium]
MYIVHGTKTGKLVDFGPTLPITCPACENKTWWNLQQQRIWFTLYFIPVFPAFTNYTLECEACGINLELHGKEGKRAIALQKQARLYQDNQLSSSELETAITKSGLMKRAMAVIPKDVNYDENAEWTSLNDELVEAIELGNYRPKDAADQIAQLLVSGININARNKNNKTALDMAKYHEVPNAIIQQLQEAGAK